MDFVARAGEVEEAVLRAGRPAQAAADLPEVPTVAGVVVGPQDQWAGERQRESPPIGRAMPPSCVRSGSTQPSWMGSRATTRGQRGLRRLRRTVLRRVSKMKSSDAPLPRPLSGAWSSRRPRVPKPWSGSSSRNTCTGSSRSSSAPDFAIARPMEQPLYLPSKLCVPPFAE